MQHDITKIAVRRALFTLILTEFSAAFLYFGTNNPAMAPFAAAFAILGVVAAMCVFSFVRAPATTRLKWAPRLCLIATIAGVGMCCFSISFAILSWLGVIDEKVDLMVSSQIFYGLYFTSMFWSKYQAALKADSDAI